MFWKEFKAPSAVCAWGWGCRQCYGDVHWVRRQLRAPCLPLQRARDTTTTPTRCKQSGFLPGGHASLLHPHRTKPYSAKPLLPLFADNLHNHHLLGQPSSDKDLLFATPVAHQQARRHLEDICDWSYGSGVSLMDCFSSTRPCQVLLRNCLDDVFLYIFP